MLSSSDSTKVSGVGFEDQTQVSLKISTDRFVGKSVAIRENYCGTSNPLSTLYGKSRIVLFTSTSGCNEQHEE